MSIRLVLADDHPIVLHGLQRLFERQADFEVVGTCTTGDEVLPSVKKLRPDVLVSVVESGEPRRTARAGN